MQQGDRARRGRADEPQKEEDFTEPQREATLQVHHVLHTHAVQIPCLRQSISAAPASGSNSCASPSPTVLRARQAAAPMADGGLGGHRGPNRATIDPEILEESSNNGTAHGTDALNLFGSPDPLSSRPVPTTARYPAPRIGPEENNSLPLDSVPENAEWCRRHDSTGRRQEFRISSLSTIQYYAH